MEEIKKYKKTVGIVIILFVIVLHGFLRISEIPNSTLLLGPYFWIPSVNLAVDKGFTDLGGNVSALKSPELSNFLNLGKLDHRPQKKYSLSDTFYKFTDYHVDDCQLKFPDARGYRFIIGVIWKYFGFNWYYVGLFNYFLSLIALLSLILCSYRTLGVCYSIIIGFIYSISPIEIYYVASFGRDGIPLWFACYLISTLILFTHKPLTLNRLIGYASLIGLIIYGAIEGRASSIYFIPLLTIIYFCLFFFFKEEKFDFRYVTFLKNSFLRRTFIFCLAVFCTAFIPFSLEAITNVFFPCWTHGASWGVIFEGLGMWGEAYNPFHPSQVKYSDKNVWYFAQEYAQRILKLDPKQVHAQMLADFGGLIDAVIPPVYISIVKTYPYFFWHDVVIGSIKNTLLFLGPKDVIFSQYEYSDRNFLSYFAKLGSYMFRSYFLFFLSFIGVLLLYFKLNLKKIATILICFVFFNAFVSFLQFHPRHVLMGHPAYYFLTGVSITFSLIFLYSLIIKNKKQLTVYLKKYWFVFFVPVMIFISYFVYYGLMNKLKEIEDQNIIEMQHYFNSLERKSFDFSFKKEKVDLPRDFLYKTIGIYCDLGEVTAPQNITIKVLDGPKQSEIYQTIIFPVAGKNVVLFYPFFKMNKYFSLSIEDNNQCKSFHWSNLKDWKGPLWEGTYDKDMLNK